jgi:hypothetical protein
MELIQEVMELFSSVTNLDLNTKQSVTVLLISQPINVHNLEPQVILEAQFLSNIII